MPGAISYEEDFAEDSGARKNGTRFVNRQLIPISGYLWARRRTISIRAFSSLRLKGLVM